MRDFAHETWHTASMNVGFPDTHRLIAKLKQHGFTEDQALGLTEAMQEFDLSQLATKADLKYQLRELELRMLTKFGGMLGIAVALLAALKVYG